MANFKPARIASYGRAGGYPIDSTFNYDTRGITGMVILFSTASGGMANVPAVTVGGAAATFMGRSGAAGSTGEAFAWKIMNPPQGELTPVRLLQSNTYADLGVVAIVGYDNATDFGFFDAKAGGTAITLEGVTTKSGGGILSYAHGHYTGGTLNLGAATGVTGNELVHSHLTDSNHPVKISTGDYTGVGTAVAVNWNVPYNQVNGCAIEVAGAAGPAKQTISPAGIANSSGVGTPLVKDPNKAILAPASIVNDASALGSPTVNRTIVAYYDRNSPDHTITGTPGTIVIRTANSNQYRASVGAVPVVEGEKKYYEVTISEIALNGTANSIVAVGAGDRNISLDLQLGGYMSDATSWDSTGGARDNNTGLNGRPTFAVGDVIGVAIDMTPGRGWIFMSKNGVWYNGTQNGNVNFSSGDGRVNNTAKPTGTPLYPAIQTQTVNDRLTTNFGRTAFAYTAPTGFTPLDPPPTEKPKQTITVGAGLVAEAEAFGVAVLTVLPLTIRPTGILADAPVFGVATMRHLIAATGILTAQEAFGTPKVNHVLKASGIPPETSVVVDPKVNLILKGTGFLAEASVFGLPKIISKIQASGIEAPASVLGSPLLRSITSVQPSGILAEASVIEAPSLRQILHHSGIDGSLHTAFGTLSVRQLLGVTGIAPEASLLGSPSLRHLIQASSISNLSELGQPSLAQILKASGILNQETLGSVSLVQVLKAQGILETALLGQPSLNQKVKAQGIEGESFVGSPVFILGGNVQLIQVDTSIVNASAFGSAKLGLNLKPLGLANVSTLGSPLVRAGTWKIEASGILAELSEVGAARIFDNTDLIFINIAGVWTPVETVYVKLGGTWREVDAVLEKQGGAWGPIY